MKNKENNAVTSDAAYMNRSKDSNAPSLLDALIPISEDLIPRISGLEASLTAFAAMTGVPVVFYSSSGKLVWSFDTGLRPCVSNQSYDKEGTKCFNDLRSSMKKSEELGDIYIFRCLTGFVNFCFALRSGNRIRGFFVAGPIIMERSTEKFVTTFFRKSDPEDIDFSILFPIMNRMRIFSPREVNYLATMFRDAILSPLGLDLSADTTYRMNQEQIQISNMLTRKKKTHASIDYPYNLEIRLMKEIEAGAYESCRNTFLLYMDELMIYEGGNQTAIRIRLIALSAQILSDHESWQQSHENLAWIDQLNSARTLSEMARSFEGLLQSITNMDAALFYTGASEIIKKAIVYINGHFRDDINVKIIADAIHVNNSYLSSLLKKELGMSAVDYIRNVRLEHAKNLLESTHLPLARVSDECGFNSQSYFTRIFREQNGLTPGEYRKLRS